MPRSPAKPGNSQRQRNERAGRRGELWAELFLRLKLYRILARRVKTPVGEIDLIAEQFGVTVFVEVKARSFSSDELEAHTAVNRKRIVRAAEYWLGRHPDRFHRDMRFDVIFLAPFAPPRHIRNAFGANR
jgi:putative endonuclease